MCKIFEQQYAFKSNIKYKMLNNNRLGDDSLHVKIKVDTIECAEIFHLAIFLLISVKYIFYTIKRSQLTDTLSQLCSTHIIL